MARKFKDHVQHEAIFHKTSIGRNPSKQKTKIMEKISWPRKVKELTKGGVYHGNLNTRNC